MPRGGTGVLPAPGGELDLGGADVGLLLPGTGTSMYVYMYMYVYVYVYMYMYMYVCMYVYMYMYMYMYMLKIVSSCPVCLCTACVHPCGILWHDAIA